MSSKAQVQIKAGSKQAFSTAPTGLLQRRCACGGSAGLTGECTDCQSKKLLGKTLQAKLRINEPGDIYEREADRIADGVMAMPAHHAVSDAPPRIQRFSGQPTAQIDEAPASVDQVLASPGRPVEPALRQDMEHRFGHDFSRVRVHSGAAAEQSARDVNAHAYTVGDNIVFGAGQFTPGTHEGRRLIAHELTHVVQRSFLDDTSGRVVMRQPKKVETKFSGCTGTQLNQIDSAAQDAKKALNKAANVVGSAYGKPSNLSTARQQLLLDHFHTTSHDDLRTILGIYTSIKIAFDTKLKFECETTCPKTKTGSVCGYAYNTMWFGGRGPIHICFDTAGCDFAVTPANDQVALVIHEAAHRHAGVDDKEYRWNPKYNTLTSKEAMDNADSYAWFAVLV